jgi:hypothetical protein
VHAVDALTVDLDDAPTIEMQAVHADSSTESAFTESTFTEGIFAEVLAEVMGVERVSVDSNFFDDLGADSMVMARFCARVRKRPELPAVSIKDIYQHRTIKSLATALGGDSPVAGSSPVPVEPAPTPVVAAPTSLEVAAPT